MEEEVAEADEDNKKGETEEAKEYAAMEPNGSSRAETRRKEYRDRGRVDRRDGGRDCEEEDGIVREQERKSERAKRRKGESERARAQAGKRESESASVGECKRSGDEKKWRTSEGE
eukprot:6196938-Pleurochrysis_carterae.AAC.2